MVTCLVCCTVQAPAAVVEETEAVVGVCRIMFAGCVCGRLKTLKVASHVSLSGRLRAGFRA